LIASSSAAKTPSASFRRGVYDHSFFAPKASDGSAIVKLFVRLGHSGTSRTPGNVRLESGKWAKADTLTIPPRPPVSALRTRVPGTSHRKSLIAAAAHHGLPAMYCRRP